MIGAIAAAGNDLDMFKMGSFLGSRAFQSSRLGWGQMHLDSQVQLLGPVLHMMMGWLAVAFAPWGLDPEPKTLNPKPFVSDAPCTCSRCMAGAPSLLQCMCWGLHMAPLASLA